MDYEKKYNEALERARANYKADKEMGFLENCDMLELIFPELCESEDERIRKELIELVNELISEPGRSGITVGKAEKYLAYLEKQKESLHISETCKENADSFTDEDERMVKDIRLALLSVDDAFWATHSLTAKEAIAWLEKQKEQKPVEWSEEDERILNELITIMDGGKVTSGTYLSEYAAWLKSLPERFNLQPKQEWNTYDKAVVTCIVCCLDGQFVTEAARKQALEWFNKHRRDFLNSPSWKPSEEQMEALRRAVNKLAKSDVADSVRLSIMYDNLKKLM